jgi:hypothetical protein
MPNLGKKEKKAEKKAEKEEKGERKRDQFNEFLYIPPLKPSTALTYESKG